MLFISLPKKLGVIVQESTGSSSTLLSQSTKAAFQLQL